MLTALTGTLVHWDSKAGLVWVALGGVTLEVHVPQSSLLMLQEAGAGAAATLHTHLEFAPQGPVGALRPRLFGFAHPLDKQFFLKLITVKGVGASVALDMMAAPTAAIAAAIQGRDELYLRKLPRIGASKAKLLIAELSGKVAGFEADGVPARPGQAADTLAGTAATVLAILVHQLDLDEREARTLLGKAREAAGEAADVETLLGAAFAARG